MKNTLKSIAFLFFISCLIISCKKEDAKVGETNNSNGEGNEKVVFLNLDSLLENYDLYTESRTLLEDESRKAEQSLASKLDTYQKRAYDFQKRVTEVQQRAADLAPVQLQAYQERFKAEENKLMQEQNDLAQKRDASAAELEKKLVNLQKNLKDKIDAHMEKIAAERGYDYVLIKGNGGGVLFGTKGLDITAQTVLEMNKLYVESGVKPIDLINEVVKDSIK